MNNQNIKIDWQIINLSEVARRLNVSQSYLYFAVTGMRKGPKSRELLRKAENMVRHWLAA